MKKLLFVTLVAAFGCCALAAESQIKAGAKSQAADVVGQALSGKSAKEIAAGKKSEATSAAKNLATSKKTEATNAAKSLATSKKNEATNAAKSLVASDASDSQIKAGAKSQAADIAGQALSGKSAKEIAAGKKSEAKDAAKGEADKQVNKLLNKL